MFGRGCLKKAFLRRWYWSRDWGSECEVRGRSVTGRGHSHSKSPEVGADVMCMRNIRGQGIGAKPKWGTAGENEMGVLTRAGLKGLNQEFPRGQPWDQKLPLLSSEGCTHFLLSWTHLVKGMVVGTAFSWGRPFWQGAWALNWLIISPTLAPVSWFHPGEPLLACLALSVAEKFQAVFQRISHGEL